MDLVTRLLSRYEENRLWVEGSVREHCCFIETDWSTVMMRNMSPHYVLGDRKMRYTLKRRMLVILRRMFLKILG